MPPAPAERTPGRFAPGLRRRRAGEGAGLARRGEAARRWAWSTVHGARPYNGTVVGRHAPDGPPQGPCRPNFSTLRCAVRCRSSPCSTGLRHPSQAWACRGSSRLLAARGSPHPVAVRNAGAPRPTGTLSPTSPPTTLETCLTRSRALASRAANRCPLTAASAPPPPPPEVAQEPQPPSVHEPSRKFELRPVRPTQPVGCSSLRRTASSKGTSAAAHATESSASGPSQRAATCSCSTGSCPAGSSVHGKHTSSRCSVG